MARASLTEKEKDLIVEAARVDALEHAVIAAIRYGGLRRLEVSALDVGDYDRVARTLRVRHRHQGPDQLVSAAGFATALETWLEVRAGRSSDLHPRDAMFIGRQGRHSPRWVNTVAHVVSRRALGREVGAEAIRGRRRSEGTYLPASQAQAVLDASRHSARDHALLSLMYWARLRPKAAIALDVGDYDPADQTVHAQVRGQQVVLPAGLAAGPIERWLAERRAPTSLPAMFTTRVASRLSPRYMRGRAKGYGRDAGLGDSFHADLLRDALRPGEVVAVELDPSTFAQGRSLYSDSPLRPLFKPEGTEGYLVEIEARAAKRQRVHGDLINAFAEWLAARGVEVTNDHQLDLVGLLQPPALVEAEVIKGDWMARVREAVGQLYEYRFFLLRQHAELILLLSEQPEPRLVDYLEGDRLIWLAWRSGRAFELSEQARRALGLRS